MRILAVALAAALLAACSTSGSSGSPVIPDKVIRLTANNAVSLAHVAQGALAVAAIYFIYDPLAPNWEIEESRLAEDEYQFSLKMKRYHTGGAGESMQILQRRVAQLQRENGYGAYQLTSFTEGIESATLGARRVASGSVRLTQPLATRQAAVHAAPVNAVQVNPVSLQQPQGCANSFLVDPC